MLRRYLEWGRLAKAEAKDQAALTSDLAISIGTVPEDSSASRATTSYVMTWRRMFEPSKHHTGHTDPWRHMSSLSDSSNWPAHAPAVDEVRLEELVTDAKIALAGNEELWLT